MIPGRIGSTHPGSKNDHFACVVYKTSGLCRRAQPHVHPVWPLQSTVHEGIQASMRRTLLKLKQNVTDQLLCKTLHFFLCVLSVACVILIRLYDSLLILCMHTNADPASLSQPA